MARVTETVSFIGIDDQLGLHSFCPKRMPELEALRSRTLTVAISHDDQRRRLYPLDVVDRGALRVDRRIVIDGLAKEGKHPLIDGVFAVVALPVADARSRNRSAEPCGLGYAEHSHEAAVAPAGKPLTVLIDREALLQNVHARKNVLEVSIAEVANISLSKLLSLAVAAARIRHEDEVSQSRERHAAVPHSRPARSDSARRTAMHADDQRIFLRRIVVRWIKQPSLNLEAVVG